MLHRYPDDLHKNLEIQFTVEELEILQKHYLRHIQDISKDNSVKVRSVFIGPRSDHSLPMSLTDSLTH